MASPSYILPTRAGFPGVSTATNAAGVPKPGQKFLDPTGNVVPSWWRFLYALVSPPTPEVSVTIGTSPTPFTAAANGTMLVAGGTVSKITLARQNTYDLGVTSGYIPMSNGDTITITFSGAPTLTWFPR